MIYDLHTVYKVSPEKQKKTQTTRQKKTTDVTGCHKISSSSISLICLHDPWWNPSMSHHASWKSYQLLTIAEDKPIEALTIQRKLTSSTLSFYLHIPSVAFIGSHFSKSLWASSLISHISIFSLLLCLPQFIVPFLSHPSSSLSLSLCEYICSKIAPHI